MWTMVRSASEVIEATSDQYLNDIIELVYICLFVQLIFFETLHVKLKYFSMSSSPLALQWPQ